MNVLAEVNKLHNVHLFKMVPSDKYTVLEYICAQLLYWKLVTILQIPLNNHKGHRLYNTTTSNYYYNLCAVQSVTETNTPKKYTPRLEGPSRKYHS